MPIDAENKEVGIAKSQEAIFLFKMTVSETAEGFEVGRCAMLLDPYYLTSGSLLTENGIIIHRSISLP